MRFLLKVHIPVEAGNTAAKAGKLGGTIQSILADLKPEAVFFTADAEFPHAWIKEKTGLRQFHRDGQDLSDNLQKILSGSPLMVILRPSLWASYPSRHHPGSCR
jgi:hypothetical protein